jgi:hypothetical protein
MQPIRRASVGTKTRSSTTLFPFTSTLGLPGTRKARRGGQGAGHAGGAGEQAAGGGGQAWLTQADGLSHTAVPSRCHQGCRIW